MKSDKHKEPVRLFSLRLGCSLLLLVTTACLNSHPGGAVENRPTAAQENEPFDLAAGYQPGQKLLIVFDEEISTQATQNGKPPIAYKSTSHIEQAVKVEGTATADMLHLTLQYLNVRAITSKDGKASEVDWFKPESPEQEERFRRARNASMSFNCDTTTGSVSSLEDQEFRESAFAGLKKRMDNEKEWDAVARRFVGMIVTGTKSAWDYLPAEPKRLGDTWHYDRPAHALRLRNMTGQFTHEVTECTFKEVRESPQGRLAVITLSGDLKNPERQTASFKIAGEIDFNLDTRLVTKQVIELSGTEPAIASHLKFTRHMEAMQENVPATDGAGAH